MENQNQLLSTIIEETDSSKIKDLTDMFNLQMAKKNLIRVAHLNDVMDNLCDQVQKRIKERPDEFSNKDLLDYFETIQNSIIKSTQNVDELKNIPQINLNQQNNITIDSNVLNSESKEKILNVVNQILKETPKLQEVIEIDENSDDSIVLDDDNNQPT